MILRDAGLPGAFLVQQERRHDVRGFFARTYSEEEFANAGLTARVTECSTSWNERRHTLRGLHLQRAPHEEVKLVRCTRGRIFDVLLDVRVDQSTFGTWVGHELDESEGQALYVPAGVAHGYLTLEPGSEVHYQISAGYAPESVTGVRWDDPDVGVVWPAQPAVMSDRDLRLPSLTALRSVLAVGRPEG